jgi:GTP-binding protein
MHNLIAIVGRPNVGKSTLYNRLIGHRQSIVDDESGVTRDRQYGSSEWNGKKFTVIDTGGFVRDSDDVFEAAIRSQVKIAIEEATVLIFMVDAATGLTDLDDQVADLLRRTNKPVILAVNKVENQERRLEANEMYSLGFDETFFISAMTGSGTGDLLDAAVEHLSEEEPPQSELPRFAIVGRPNAGKSSLINALMGEERNIVTEIAGTTRDSIDTVYNKFDKEFILVDTAGIRKKSKVSENLEFYSVMRSIKAIETSDVCLIIIDAEHGMEGQDVNIFRLAQRRNKGIVILVNKWDLIEKDTHSVKKFTEQIHERIAPFKDVPILFISALEKQRIFQAVEKALEVYENRSRRIPTSQLNEVMQAAIERYPPPSYRGRFIKIKYVSQLPLAYPAFAFFCNSPKHVRENYKHYLENQLREHFDFTGVPITIFFRQK